MLYVKESAADEWRERTTMAPVTQHPCANNAAVRASPTYRDDERSGFHPLDPSAVVPANASIGDPGAEVKCGLGIALLDGVKVINNQDAVAADLVKEEDRTETLSGVRFAPQRLASGLFASFSMKIDDAWKKPLKTASGQNTMPPADADHVHMRHLVLYGERDEHGNRPAAAYIAPRLMAKLAYNWVSNVGRNFTLPRDFLRKTRWHDVLPE